jgi:hypothetical protein
MYVANREDMYFFCILFRIFSPFFDRCSCHLQLNVLITGIQRHCIIFGIRILNLFEIKRAKIGLLVLAIKMV